MLPDIVLDNEEFEEILNKSINTVVNTYPEWTDFNAHDPGVTILELFAAMKESQQFFMDQIGEENEKKYLKLLGMEKRRKRPAHSLVQIEVKESCLLLAFHKLDAGGLCFETGRQRELIRGDICSCFAVCGDVVETFASRGQMEFGSQMRFRAFGKAPEQGNVFYICLEESLPEKVPLELYVGIYQEEGAERNPLRGFGFVPLVKLTWQYYTGQGWENMEEVGDETYAFLFDGFIRFQTRCRMERTSVFGRQGYFIRAVLQEGEYDIPPVLAKISMNICEVVQQDTLAECIVLENPCNGLELTTELSVLGISEVYIGQGDLYYPAEGFRKEICAEEGCVRFAVEDSRLSGAGRLMIINRDIGFLEKRVLGDGNGFPFQEIDLEDLQAVYESFDILVRDAWEDGYRLWEKVEDFAASSAEDRHYIFDSQRGVVRFGDCIHGMAPEGEILLAGYQRTMGSGGNVKAGKINRFRMEGLEGLVLSNICEGYGGCDEETLEECFFRARKYIREAECAVTKQDYERYVKQTPGLLIDGCKVLHFDEIRRFVKKTDETAVYLVVKPYGWKTGSRVEESYYRNIRNYLENYRMIGSRIFIFFPEYVEIEVYVEAAVKPQYLHIGERVRQKVRDFFDAYKGAFGGAVSYSRLYGFLDRQDFILEIHSLNLESRGGGVLRNAEGDILLPPYGAAVLKEVRMSLTA
ncbi:MAG: hypothetical protein HFH72_04785 [Lachnospiraceae bacterium]|nr:hypothetical protein [Lachnospiraceae bacterium]